MPGNDSIYSQAISFPIPVKKPRSIIPASCLIF
jgi:hypothetical protein